MAKAKRVFLLIADSFGIGEEPDAGQFGDLGSNTLRSCYGSSKFHCPNLQKLGLFNIDGVKDGGFVRPENIEAAPIASYARMRELSLGKDTVIGHWELSGLISPRPMPTFPDGFPEDFIRAFEERVGRHCIVNKPYSGTKVLEDYGEYADAHGYLIVYTSADSVFQIAANEAIVPIEELYRDCEIAREMLQGPLAVGRVIARPYVGTSAANYERTPRRHDYALPPFGQTMLDVIQSNGMKTLGVGKINDIFAGKGISDFVRTTGNPDGLNKTMELAAQEWEGLCFVNLVDFDMLYGHRRDIDGYAQALTDLDTWLEGFMKKMNDDDVLMISADHGCDPAFPYHTDHTREYVPLIVYGKNLEAKNLGTRQGFTFCADTVMDLLGINYRFSPTM